MIEGINGTNGATSATGPDSAGGLSQLGSDAFLKLLVAQLRYQNPLKPTDPSSMLGQTAQFTTVETLQAISEMQQELMGFQQSVGAMGMIGRHVRAVGTSGETIEGIIERVTFGDEGAMLTVNGHQVSLDAVVEAAAAPEADGS